MNSSYPPPSSRHTSRRTSALVTRHPVCATSAYSCARTSPMTLAVFRGGVWWWCFVSGRGRWGPVRSYAPMSTYIHIYIINSTHAPAAVRPLVDELVEHARVGVLRREARAQDFQPHGRYLFFLNGLLVEVLSAGYIYRVLFRGWAGWYARASMDRHSAPTINAHPHK